MMWPAPWSHRLHRALLALSPPSERLVRDFRFRRDNGIEDSVLAHFPLERRFDGRAVDVGANIGAYSYAFAQGFDAVEAFEPQPSCATGIERFAERAKHVRVHRLGLSDRRARVVLNVPIVRGRFRDHRATGLATLSAVGGRTDPLTIDVVPLDDFAFDDVSLIKIDVEGHERAVIAGAERTIALTRPTLIVEIEQRHLHGSSIYDAFAQIISLGYVGWFFRGDVLERLEEFSQERDQLPYVAEVAAGRTPDAYVNNFVFEPLDRRRPPLFAP
jgi:FkbM family methyltransferase